jgi:sulfite reductase (NADPH) flavoprotein alpha-component
MLVSECLHFENMALNCCRPMSTSETTSVYSRKNPFPAKVMVNRALTSEGSNKDTRHYELSLKGSGLTYEVGDSLGIFCTNDPELVDEILKSQGFTGDELVENAAKQTVTVRQALTNDCVITQPDRKFLTALVEKADAAPLLKELLDPSRRQDLEQYLWGQEVIDFLLEHPSVKFTPQELVSNLRKLQPRLYSIASSLKAYPEQVHLTIATVRYESRGRKRKGVCSTFLAERTTPETPVPVFVHVAKGFRLPEDGNTPVIMVGPGTGVAPFRAFLQERKATGAKGSNWLFFGEQKAKSDFFYKDEFEAAQKEGVLTKFHTAFSRDQEHKIYVQHRMLENAADLWAWIKDGAHFFVCGDASRMAKDVDDALHQIVREQGGMDATQAAEYIETMKKEKRYKRDVY